jgi:hypothetical protein
MTSATKIATTVLVAMVVVCLSAGSALAALPLIVGTDAAERITGTKVAEEIRGLGGSDEITDGLGGTSSTAVGEQTTSSATVGTPQLIASTAVAATTSSSPETFPRSRTWWVAAVAQTPFMLIRPTSSEATASG